MHVRRSLGGVVLVFMNATGIQYFAGNHILTKTYYGSPLEVARAFQSPAPPFHYTCPALLNCKSMSKCDEKHLRCNLPCQVLSIVGLDTFMHVVGTDLQLVHVWVHFIARYYIFLVR